MTRTAVAIASSPLILVVATGAPAKPAQYFVIHTAATATALIAALIFYRVGLPPPFAFSLALLLILAKAKALDRMGPQRLSVRSGSDGALLVQGSFSERTISRRAEMPVKAVRVNAGGSLLISSADDTPPVTLDTSCFRPERLQALEQLLNAMLAEDLRAIDTIASHHRLKHRGRNGSKAFFLMEYPNVIGLTLCASGLGIALFFTLLGIAP
jgi:hypothetical protein